MHPSSLLSYYPNYAILDEIVTKKNYNTLNIYIDLKNNLQSTYMEHAIVNIVSSSKKAKFFDTSIFSAVISFLTFHKMWALKRAVNVNFYIFFESGISYYHKNISKTYKISRQIDDLYGLDKQDRELFFRVLQANFRLIERALNLIPKIKVIRLNHLEADFVPYYLITRNKVDKLPTTAHVVYSNDHDLWQCLKDNVYVFSKAGKTKRILEHGNVIKYLTKKPNTIPDEYLPLAMAIIGDVGDDVTGIDGIGPATFLKVFPELIKLTGNIETIYQKVRNNSPLFDPLPTSSANKILKKIIDAELASKRISKNLKLVSFELISREFDDPNSTEMLDRKKEFEKKLIPVNPVPLNDMKRELNKTGIVLESTSIDFLYM